MIGMLLIAAFPISALIGARVGYRCGRQGLRLGAACIRAWERSALLLGISLFGLAVIDSVFRLMGGSDPGETLTTISTALLVCATLGILISILPAPMAAFIAHNFGTQRRIRDELAQPRKQFRE